MLLQAENNVEAIVLKGLRNLERLHLRANKMKKLNVTDAKEAVALKYLNLR